MQSDQVMLPVTPITYDMHMSMGMGMGMGMGILGTKALQHVHEEMFHREFYSDDSIFSSTNNNSRFLFYPPPPSPPSMPLQAVEEGQIKAAPVSVGQLQESSSGHSQSEEAEEQQNQNQILVIDERKKRRMLSNRESARRSRMRKQKHLDELRAQVAHVRAENRQLLSRFEIVSRSYIQILDENRVLKSQAMDLSRQLQQLHQAIAASQSAASFAAAFKLYNNNNNNIEIDDAIPHNPDLLL